MHPRSAGLTSERWQASWLWWRWCWGGCRLVGLACGGPGRMWQCFRQQHATQCSSDLSARSCTAPAYKQSQLQNLACKRLGWVQGMRRGGADTPASLLPDWRACSCCASNLAACMMRYLPLTPCFGAFSHLSLKPWMTSAVAGATGVLSSCLDCDWL